jgi:hypothetical protein
MPHPLATDINIPCFKLSSPSFGSPESIFVDAFIGRSTSAEAEPRWTVRRASIVQGAAVLTSYAAEFDSSLLKPARSYTQGRCRLAIDGEMHIFEVFGDGSSGLWYETRLEWGSLLIASEGISLPAGAKVGTVTFTELARLTKDRYRT